MSDADAPRPGLRERKRLKTLASIQAHALRLFAEHGYDATTVPQIAEAADVSESTFFRYFPTKEDVVLLDDLDSVFVDSLRGQAPELSSLEAIRRAMRELFSQLTADENAQQRTRIALILSVPGLRARMLDQIFAGTTLITDLIAEREDSGSGDTTPGILAGAVIGAGIAALLTLQDDPHADLASVLDEALGRLEHGFEG
jgi:AcrR family transcriptional regulator